MYKTTVKNTIQRIFYDCKQRAKNKDLSFNLTIKYIIDLYNTQNGKCAISGLPFNLIKDQTIYKDPYIISIDRINSARGYTKDNIQLVIGAINFMKSDLEYEDFIFFCKQVIKNNE